MSDFNEKLSLSTIPFFERLKNAKNILLAGAGGGYDIYSGIPLYFSLKKSGKKVHLANLSFTSLGHTDAEKIHKSCRKVIASSEGPDYFPEKYLCEWFNQQGEEIAIYSFPRTGVIKLASAYKYLCETLEIDAIVLVDGGTDSLMFGDEPSLGTPFEDASSILAAWQTDVKEKILCCLGFGIDAYHGISHYHFLENVAELAKEEAYYGCFSLLPQMQEAKRFSEATAYANSKMRPSIVSNSIKSALEGYYGNHHATLRTITSELWINPLMYIYWAFNLDAVANKMRYKDLILETKSFMGIMTQITRYIESIERKGKKKIPL